MFDAIDVLLLRRQSHSVRGHVWSLNRMPTWIKGDPEIVRRWESRLLGFETHEIQEMTRDCLFAYVANYPWKNLRWISNS